MTVGGKRKLEGGSKENGKGGPVLMSCLTSDILLKCPCKDVTAGDWAGSTVGLFFNLQMESACWGFSPPSSVVLLGCLLATVSAAGCGGSGSVCQCCCRGEENSVCVSGGRALHMRERLSPPPHMAGPPPKAHFSLV